MDITELPQSFMIGNRRYFKRSEIEFLKRVISAKAFGADAPTYMPPEVEHFVNASAVARELGISRRTISRKVKEQASDDRVTL